MYERRTRGLFESTQKLRELASEIQGRVNSLEELIEEGGVKVCAWVSVGQDPEGKDIYVGLNRYRDSYRVMVRKGSGESPDDEYFLLAAASLRYKSMCLPYIPDLLEVLEKKTEEVTEEIERSLAGRKE